MHVSGLTVLKYHTNFYNETCVGTHLAEILCQQFNPNFPTLAKMLFQPSNLVLLISERTFKFKL